MRGGFQMLTRKILMTLVCAIALPAVAMENPVPSDTLDEQNEVKSFHLFGGMDGWNALGRDALIVWTSPSKAYLVQLRRPSHGLRFATQIGITSTVGTVSAGFDSVIVEGWRYPIKSIHTLDRARAKELLSSANRSS
jgi:hypothetical protein